MSDTILYNKITTLPEDLKQEVVDFIDFLQQKMKSQQPAKNPKAGLAKGLIIIKDDFDDPLEDFKDYM